MTIIKTKGWKKKSIYGFRDITGSTNERTFLAAGVPELALLAIVYSLVFDYVARQKIGSSHANIFIVKQFPIPAPEDNPDGTKWEMAKCVIELQYFNHDMDAWGKELWEEMTDKQRAEMPTVGSKEPFIFDPDRRAVLQA